MRYAILILALAAAFTGCQHAPHRKPSSDSTLKPRLSLDQLSRVENQHVLIVTHATEFFDTGKSAAEGIDRIIQQFKDLGRPVIYLVSDQSDEGYRQWYTRDRAPDFEIFSEGGEHNIPLAASEVTIIGGFFGSTDTLNGCHALSMKDAIRMHFQTSKADLTIHVPLAATYFYDEWSFQREHILKNGKPLLSSEIPYPFASMYFLREGNEGAGDDGNEQYFAHDYTGKENKTYHRGDYQAVSRKTHQFHFYVNDQLFESVVDSGKQRVNIRLETR